MRIFNQTKNTVIAENADLADSFFARMKGLLGKDSLKESQGLVITRCNSIHMFFMKFAIDVIFLNAKGEVVGLKEDIKPFRLSQIYWKANRAVEIPVGAIQRSRTELGDQISY